MENNEYTSFVIDDTTYETTLTKKFINRKVWQQPDPHMIASVLPGTILEIYVKPGDTVKAGDKLFLFEAMKMHTIVAAPFDAKVKSVDAAEGDKVAKEHIIVELQ